MLHLGRLGASWGVFGEVLGGLGASGGRLGGSWGGPRELRVVLGRRRRSGVFLVIAAPIAAPTTSSRSPVNKEGESRIDFGVTGIDFGASGFDSSLRAFLGPHESLFGSLFSPLDPKLETQSIPRTQI